MTRSDAPSALAEVGRYFFRLGVIAFGGPAAHVAIMRRELVQERRWATDEEFVDYIGVASLIPGPNSTELTMHMGAHRAGWWGLWLGGAAFILPAFAIVLAFAWAYVEYGTTTARTAVLDGIEPVILAVILQAVWGLRFAVAKGLDLAAVALIVGALAALGVSEIVLILGAGVAMLLWRGATTETLQAAMTALSPARLWEAIRGRWRGMPALLFVTSPPGFSLAELFWLFLKIGGTLYGSGYVLIAFLETDFIDARGWLTEQQLVDAVAVGQFTPGPVFTTATFVGYALDGTPGALVATAGIFLPSFAFVALTHPLVPRLRRSRWASPFLDGVNAAAVAVMAVVVVSLGREVLDGAFAWGAFAIAAVVLLRYRPGTVWLVLAGAAAGGLHAAVT